MNLKTLLCLALVLGGGLAVRNCQSAIIYPKPPEGAKQIATHQVAGFNGFLGVTNMGELTVTDPHQVYIAENQDVISGRLLSAAKPVVGWDYFIIRGTNAVGTVFLEPDKTNGTTLHCVSMVPPNREIAEALRTAEQLPQVKQQDYELRFLNLFPLSFLAIWLHAKSDDIIIPFLAPVWGGWRSGQPYSEGEITRLLKPGAMNPPQGVPYVAPIPLR